MPGEHAKLIPDKPSNLHDMVKTKVYDDEAFLEGALHDMIEDKDNLMQGVYKGKNLTETGTDPMEIEQHN